MDVFWGVLAAGLLTLVFVWSLLDAERRPARWGRLYSLGPTRRALRWIAAAWALALVIARLSGADGTVYAVIGVVGFSAAYIAWRFFNAAWWNDLLRRLLDR